MIRRRYLVNLQVELLEIRQVSRLLHTQLSQLLDKSQSVVAFTALEERLWDAQDFWVVAYLKLNKRPSRPGRYNLVVKLRVVRPLQFTVLLHDERPILSISPRRVGEMITIIKTAGQRTGWEQ